MASKPSNTHSSLLELKAITAEHADQFAKQGRTAVRGGPRSKVQDVKSKDQFDRPSPGLVKRLAREARADAKTRHFTDGSGVNEEQRRLIMEAKAKKYDALKRGDLEGFTERELAEANIDFDHWSDHSSDVDESAAPPREVEVDTLDDMEMVEYVDEMGRSRTGTRREAREAERERDKGRVRQPQPPQAEAGPSSFAEVQKSTFIHGEQNYFPVYQPDPEAMKKKYMEAEKEARAHHYDSTKEVRIRGAGAYQFSLDEEERAKQMAELDAERSATDRARAEKAKRGGLSAAQEAKKRRLEDRIALVEAKRAKLLGGAEKVAQLREKQRAKDADTFLQGLEDEFRKSPEK